ncbi:MAG: leucyl aminopeptidase [Pseudomonadota bacterium]|jgi:leucyl aminopeptidase|nr:leucyl aminopeptidase [Alphaproteobacteria bacterium]
MKIVFVDKSLKGGLLVSSVYEKAQLGNTTKALDKLSKGFIKTAIDNAEFKGGVEKMLRLPSVPGLSGQLLLLGLGDPKAHTALTLEKVGARLFTCLNALREKKAIIDISDISGVKDLSVAECVAYLASGALIRSWKFDKYKTKREKEDLPVLNELVFVTPSVKESQKAFDKLEAIAGGNRLTRLVVSEPPNVVYPEAMAKYARELKKIGVQVQVLGEKEMKKLGFGALLGVGQGSVRESQLVIMKWMGSAKRADKPIAIVGKGITFDTGGINIKPSNGMEDMKYDMAGSGVVLGLMKSLAMRKAKVNVVGVMALAENMPSGSAQRPSDVVKSLSGQTIEVLNTDAEGRLVLADALWYTQAKFKPQYMIDLATLTGAVTVALGYEYAGLFSNNDKLCDMLTKAGETVGEPLWRLPMGKAYDKDINSDVADVKNVGSGRGAGSITAAQFLERFVNKTPWAHLDIAGMAWDKADKPLTGKGATGYGVRLLNEFLVRNFEK